jgi:ferredoxin--NADP+ reductase
VCPVDCIHPTPAEPGFATAEMLYVDPDVCIDCGACVEACPVDAAKDELDLEPREVVFLQLNASYYKTARDPAAQTKIEPVKREAVAGLRVAVVGAGAAGCFTALQLLRNPGVTVDMFERELVPFGLVRFGVAPDHQDTKAVTKIFDQLASKRGFTLHLGVEIGRDLLPEDLAAGYHAVVYATGAGEPRQLEVEGAHMPGLVAAAHVYGWYNSSLEPELDELDLSSETVVIVGNGNVALDIGRTLLSSGTDLGRSDISSRAVAHLENSPTREVVVLGRRGPESAAFTTPELVGLTFDEDVAVRVEPAGAVDAALELPDLDPLTRVKLELMRDLADQADAGAERQLVLRFWSRPAIIRGVDRVDGVVVVEQAPDSAPREITIETSTVISSIGLGARPLEGVPHDADRGFIPTMDHRVLDADGTPSRGLYAVGWAAQGSSGGIGTNKLLSQRTATAIEDDYAAGHLGQVADDAAQKVTDALASADRLGMEDWRRLDAQERAAGADAGRPRIKASTRQEILDILARAH